MNDNQKERLLKIAETNPELAKDVVDILKQESQQSNEPIAVKMVKAEDDKIEITAEQKKWAKCLAFSYVSGFVVFGFCALISLISMILTKSTGAIVPSIFGLIFLALANIFNAVFAYKAGVKTVKDIFNKKFKFI